MIDVDLSLAKEAAKLNAKFSLSYPDCFATALAKMKRAELRTGDKEFRKLGGEIKIKWL
ncbi:MAG: PIN domain-containing protein [Candidatus Aminicenantes bacterium]|nr:PIN domain-containing protein [Candidatus Aminicenantes bacterium]